jgi:hypothetical protein
MLREAELKWTRALAEEIASGSLEDLGQWQRWREEDAGTTSDQS